MEFSASDCGEGTSQRLSSPIPFTPKNIEAELKSILDESSSESDFSHHNSVYDPDFEVTDEFYKDKNGFAEATPLNLEIPTLNEESPIASNNGIDQLLYPRSVKDTNLPSRKKRRNSNLWQKNIAKYQREQGKEYTNPKGKKKPARTLKPALCGSECNNYCLINFNNQRRTDIHTDFWCLDDQKKKFFYAKFVQRSVTARKRTAAAKSRRLNTFKYFFENHGNILQVCKTFFTATLDISQQRIYHFFKYNYNETGSQNPVTPRHNPRRTSENKLAEVRRHIESFPCIDAHYVRASSQKQYLEAGLDLSKMYRLYKLDIASPVTITVYRNLFNTEYNLGFYKPKKDLCDHCTRFSNLMNPSEVEEAQFQSHKGFNERPKLRRQMDRDSKIPTVAIISYDLQSVFTLPHANISNLYYKRKLSMYNLTGLCSLNKITYCSIWYESQSGRSGNDIASALIRILKAVVNDNVQVNHLILWSDSCIPQNKNRITSLALQKFREDFPQIKKIEQRFSAGHSRIQELDAVHSVIDRHLKNILYYSPLSLIRVLNNMNYKNVTLKIMQLGSADFFNYSAATNGLSFVPYAKVKEIIYDDLLNIKYREDYGENTPVYCVSLYNKTSIRKNKGLQLSLPIVRHTKSIIIISKEKKDDIRSMLPWMPFDDVAFYETLLKKK